MTLPLNIFDPIEQFTNILSNEDMLEGRFENDGDGNPIYVGYSPTPNADPAMPLWYIMKIEYSGTAVIRKRLPDEGVTFKYLWNDRATYFV